jgi:hypothetical protein
VRQVPLDVPEGDRAALVAELLALLDHGADRGPHLLAPPLLRLGDDAGDDRRQQRAGRVEAILRHELLGDLPAGVEVLLVDEQVGEAAARSIRASTARSRS